jgi:hypothetical protein
MSQAQRNEMYLVRKDKPSFSRAFSELPMPIFESLNLVEESRFRLHQLEAA